MSRKLICPASLILLLGLAPLAQAGLVGWWQLDEETGTTAKDSSGGGNDGTLEGNPTIVDGPSGKALAFTFNRVAIPASDSLTADLFKGTFTVAAWINPTRTGNTWQQVFRAIRTAGNSNDTLFLHTDGRLSWRGLVNGAWAGGMCETAGGVVPADQWTHVAVTGDKTNFRIYVNGALTQTSNWQTTDGSNATYYLGGDPATAGESYNGMIDEARVYDLVLTLEQIKEICVGDAPALAKAQDPTPAHGALAVAMPLLQWKPGLDALLHSVYVGTTPELTEANLVASRQVLTMHYYVQGLQPGATYYWRVDEIAKDGTTVHPGNVWTFVAQALTAYYPTPADGAADIAPAAVLTWLPGQTAVKHHLYLGDSQDAVSQGAAGADKGELTDPTFTPAALEPLTTYYWRVDETVAGGSVRAGPVWKFTTCLPVDDFESYTDDLDAKTTIFDTWIDGLTNGLSGSVVGNSQAPFAEQTIVHGGKQSMPLDYNNVKSPFYSEAEREFAPAQDWTAGGVDTLSFYVRGRSGNKPAPVYVALEDTSKQVGIVTHPDPAVTAATQWTQWKIPLSSFAGVNLARVKKMVIGVGDRQNPAAGSAGRIYLDDIVISMPAPDQ
jgi:hypothetical protein